MIGMWRYWLLLWLLSPSSLVAEVFFARMTHVSDGDTLWVLPQGSQTPRKLRLLGVDAPEICQVGGIASRDTLQHLLEHQWLHVTVNYQDRYDRGLAQVRVGQQDVGEFMVSSGQAWSSRWHRSPGLYATQERAARVTRLGLFANPRPEVPRDFRKRVGSCHPTKP